MSNNKPKLILTEDGSYTFHHPDFDENTHTIHGAYTESLYKHVYPSEILKNKGRLFVLDIGFGLGYNLLALIDEAKKHSAISGITAFSFEYDRSLTDYIEQIQFPDRRESWYTVIKKLFAQGTYKDDFLDLTMLFGDARNCIQGLGLPENSVDAVFHDPHSPGKNAELWTVDFFAIEKRLLKPGGMLTTYSSALQARRAMCEAGFHIIPYRDARFRKEGTLAAASKRDGCVSENYLAELKENIKAEPFRDNPGLTLTREKIIEERLNRMRKRREKS